MNKSDIKKVIYNGDEITSLYWGGSLIYHKQSSWNPRLLKGKFSDDSTEDDWECKINSVSKKLPVDPTTKEFEYELTEDLIRCTQMFGYRQGDVIKIERIDNFPDTSKVTNMTYMFYGCNNLTSLDLSNFDTSKVTNMAYMFRECNNLTSLDLSNFDTSNVTSMLRMFYGCNNLTSLDLSNFDTSNVKSMEYMFHRCNNLTSLDLSNFDTSKVTNMVYMFHECNNLTSLNLAGWDVSNVVNMTEMFGIDNGSTSTLTTVIGPISGIKVNLYLSDSPLTNDSAMVFINGLEEVEETKKIGFKSITYDTLTEEQIALATSKGWSVIKY